MDPQKKEWSEEMLKIATEWLFSDVKPERFPRVVILPLENPDLHDHRKFVSRLSKLETYRSISIGTHYGERVGILRSKFGAPAVAMTTSVLSVMNVHSILGVGFCGGLQKDIDSGEIIFPLACVRDDGTTSHYVSNNYPAVADIEILNVLRNSAKSLRITSHCGVILSTDAIMLESSDLVDKWSNSKVIAVDMESGALYTVARLFGMRAGCILVASDNPASRKHANSQKVSSGLNLAIDLALRTAAQL